MRRARRGDGLRLSVIGFCLVLGGVVGCKGCDGLSKNSAADMGVEDTDGRGADGAGEDMTEPEDMSGTFTIGGTVEGLVEPGLVLVNQSDGETLTVAEAGTFEFSVGYADGAEYDVAVESAPLGESCTVSSASGAVSGTDVTDVVVDCQLSVYSPFGEDGAYWNSYLNLAGGAPAPCDPAGDGTDWTGCIHAGEMRAVKVPEVSDCADVTATDELDAFEWSCDDSGSRLRMVSRLKSDVPLATLIDFSALVWKKNAVTMFRADDMLAQTISSVWWENEITENNSGGPLSSAGGIHVVTQNSNAEFLLDGDGVVLVVAPGASLTGTGTGDSVISSTSPGDFRWFEGVISAPNNGGISLSEGRFNVLRHVTLDGIDTRCLDLQGIHKSRIEQVTANDCEDLLRLVNASGNHLSDIMGAGSVIYESASSNVFERSELTKSEVNQIPAWDIDSDSASNSFAEIQLVDYLVDSEGPDNVFTTLRIAHESTANLGLQIKGPNNRIVDAVVNGRVALYAPAVVVGLLLVSVPALGLETLHGWQDSIVKDVTGANSHSLFADRLYYPSDTPGEPGVVISNVASVNAAPLYLHALDEATVENVAALHSGAGGMNFYLASAKIYGSVVLGGNPESDCVFEESSITGLSLNSQNECFASQSQVELVTGASAADSFRGKVESDDSKNPDDDSGAAEFAVITDWTSFEYPWRTWGLEGGPFPSDDHRGDCAFDKTCRIWSWALRTDDTTLFERNPKPTGDDTITHTWSDGSETTFLRNARELMVDGVGNENGLCESNEACLYTPNIGYFQGHGGFIDIPFTDGEIQNVDFYSYRSHGIAPNPP